MKKYLVFVFMIFTFTFAFAIPPYISFQGVLKDSTGTLVTATKDITFKIYDDPTVGTMLWNETQTVSVEGGLYTVELGSINPLSSTLFNGDTRYLAVVLDGIELLPRTMMVSVPYAFWASYADTAGSSGGGGGNVVLFCPTTAQTTSSANAINIQSSAAGSAPNNYVTVVSLEASGPYAIGVAASATNASSPNVGGAFGASGPSGFGVYGYATGNKGIGLMGRSSGLDGYAVQGNASSPTGQNHGGYFTASGDSGRGVYGKAMSDTGVNYGVYGETNSPSGYGVYGKGQIVSGFFESGAAGSLGVRGKGVDAGGSFEATSGYGVGVYGYTTGSDSKAIYGYTTGNNIAVGVQGVASDNKGTGVRGAATYTSSKNYGVYGDCKSPDGYAGYFTSTGNNLGVRIPIGYPNGTQPTGTLTDEGTLRVWKDGGGTYRINCYLNNKWNRISMEAF